MRRARSHRTGSRPSSPSLLLGLDGSLLRIRPHEDRVRDLDDLVGRNVCPRGVLPNLLRTRRLVDADGADGAAALLEHVAADPADVVRHFLVADLGRPSCSFLKLLRRAPAAATED